MNPILQEITLKSEQHFGRRLPPYTLGKALVEIPVVVRSAISMAFRGRSGAHGKRPGWLTAASDIRFVGHIGTDESVLQFEVPRLGEAAGDLYKQGELWPSRPDGNDTGFDLWCDILADVDAKNEDSDRFDPLLLRRLSSFNRVFDGTFQEMLITGQRYTPAHPGRMNSTTIATAKQLYCNTPAPRRVRLAGILDMIRASTLSFALRLDDGQEVRGALAAGQIEDLAPLLHKRVMVLGKAIYRASGRLLRVDADEILLSSENDRFFSTVPPATHATLNLKDELRRQQHKVGLAAIIGKWPGDETDDEIEQALNELS
jgi:hypothetical protein